MLTSRRFRSLPCLLLASGGTLVAQDGPLFAVGRALQASTAKVSPWGGLTFGHVRLEGPTAKVAVVKAPAPMQGLYLEGGLRLVYTSGDPAETQRIRTNLGRNGLASALSSSQNGEVVLALDEALVWSAGLPVAVPTEGEALPCKRAEELQQAFRYPQRASALNAVIHAASEGGKAVLVLGRKGNTRVQVLLDPHADQVEELCLLLPSPDGRPERTRLAVVSRQALGWDWKSAPGPVVLQTRVDLDFKGVGVDDAELQVKTTVQAARKPSRTLRFQLLEEILIDDGRPGMVRLPIRVKSVRLAGQDLTFAHVRHELLVALPKPLEPGASAELEISLQAPFRRRVAGSTSWELHAQPWYPQIAGPGQGYIARICLALPEGEVPIAPGKTVRRASANGQQVLETELATPVKDLVLAGGAYKSQSLTKDGLRVMYWSTSGHGSQSTAAQHRMLQYLQFFAALHGSAAFPEVQLVERDVPTFAPPLPGWLWHCSGAPNPTLPVYRQKDARVIPVQMNIGWTGRMVLPPLAPSPDGRAGLSLGGLSSGPQRVVAETTAGRTPTGFTAVSGQGTQLAQALAEHGMAYQAARFTYGQMLKPQSYEDVWLLESLATYMGGRAMNAVVKGGAAFEERLAALWRDEATRTATLCPLPHALDLVSDREGEMEDGPALLYGKGAWALQDLAATVGEAGFLSTLRVVSKPTNWGWKPLNTYDFARVLAAVTRQQPTVFIEATVRGTALPGSPRPSR